MALPAVKHLDPVVGVDVHSVLVTPGTPPVFLPHPHVGFMLDKREYIQAAKAVVGCIAMMIVQDKVAEYIEDHPEDVKKLEHLAEKANQQVNELMDGGKLPDTVVEGMKLANDANKIKNRISDDLGSNVGSGGSSGRPIFVNGMMRATAGTHAYHVPGLHFPLGESFAPPPEEVEPSNDGESFMGSKTVLANNDPMSYMALEALSCWSIGMEPPPHNSAHTDRTYPSMPSSVMLPIPTGRPVLVGGPPIMNMAAAAKGLFKAFRGSKWAKALADKLNLKPGFLRCKVLHAEPVDATTGEVIVQQSDFTLPGNISLVWHRCYASREHHHGIAGVRWTTPADIRLEPIFHDAELGVTAHFPDHAAAFDRIPDSVDWSERARDWQRGHTLYRNGEHLVVRTRQGIEYWFSIPASWQGIMARSKQSEPVASCVDRISDLNGNAWDFKRNPDGHLVRIVEVSNECGTGRSIECVRSHDLSDSSSTSLSLIDESGHRHLLVNYVHDQVCDLVSVIDPMANPHHFAYEGDHRMVRHTSARGTSFYYSYQQTDDRSWRVDHAWGDNGLFDYRFEYDSSRLEVRIVNSLGHTTILQMNSRGMPILEIDALGGMTGYTYDAQGRANARIDANGNVSRWQYDIYGNLLSEVLPDGSTIRSEYDVEHRPVSIVAPGKRQWLYEWDVCGNLTRQTMPSGATVSYFYNALGQLTSRVSARGATTRFEYDRNGQVSALIDALGNRTSYVHDVCGNVVRSINSLGQESRYEYDRTGKLLRAVEPDGSEIRCTYDADGNLSRYCDQAGQLTLMEYSAQGEILRRVAPDGQSIEYRYDTEARLVAVVNERGERHTVTRDALGQVVEEVDYWGQAWRREYSASGSLSRTIDPMGRTTDYVRDSVGRLTCRRTFDRDEHRECQVETFSYDAAGNLSSMAGPHAHVTLIYDQAGRIIREQQGEHFVVSFKYDEAGNRIERNTRLTVFGKTVVRTVRYEYDLLDLVASIQFDDVEPIRFDRDALGQIECERFNTTLRRSLTYTSNGLHATRILESGPEAIASSAYLYDVKNELIERRDSRLGVERYQYDPVGRLTRHLDPVGHLHDYGYDPAGNLLSTQIHRRETGNRFGLSGGTEWVRTGCCDGRQYVYDRSGNLIERNDPGSTLTLHWDGNGRLTESKKRSSPAERRQGEEGVHELTRYSYDALHRRISKTTYVLHEQKVRTSRFYWDGDVLIGTVAFERSCDVLPDVIDASGKLEAVDMTGDSGSAPSAGLGEGYEVQEWIHYPGTFHPLVGICHSPTGGENSATLATAEMSVMKEPPVATASFYFFDNDPSGTPQRLFDPDGCIRWEATYSAWGKCAAPNKSVDQPIRRPGQYFDKETGFAYNRYRYYDASIGAFISPDPIGLAGGVNPYQFAPNAVGWIDPWGLRGLPGHYWNAIQSYAKHQYEDLGKQQGVATLLVTVPRNRYKDISARKDRRGVSDFNYHPDLEDSLDIIEVVADDMNITLPRHHGACGEVNVIDLALKDGIDPRGALVITVDLGNRRRDGTFPIKPPCRSCQLLLEMYGVKDLE